MEAQLHEVSNTSLAAGCFFVLQKWVMGCRARSCARLVEAGAAAAVVEDDTCSPSQAGPRNFVEAVRN